ncbi:MAG: hypothetical protein EKK29_06000 [Hyphomicrobiales bacterium]|nr:MAG: hypothetical protein EKK29_06000 [Hyphomicrobiales bacterium]
MLNSIVLGRKSEKAIEWDTELAERIRLIELKAEESVADTTCGSNDIRADGRRKGPKHQESDVRAASRELGVNREDARRATKVANRQGWHGFFLLHP